MAKDKEEEEVEDDKDSASVCVIAEYEILSDKRQYILKAPKGDNKNAQILGYYHTLSGCISEIRDQEMKKHHVLTPEEVTEYMKNKNRLMETESTQRAYMLAKQLEETKKRTDEFLGSLKFLKDK